MTKSNTPAPMSDERLETLRRLTGCLFDWSRHDANKTIAELVAEIDRLSTSLAAERGVARAKALEEAAKAVEPKRPRPCDCDTCYCGNHGDMEAVAAWDADAAAAKSIRALKDKDPSNADD